MTHDYAEGPNRCDEPDGVWLGWYHVPRSTRRSPLGVRSKGPPTTAGLSTEPEKTTCKNDMGSGGPGREKFEFETASMDKSDPLDSGIILSREILAHVDGKTHTILNGFSTVKSTKSETKR